MQQKSVLQFAARFAYLLSVAAQEEQGQGAGTGSFFTMMGYPFSGMDMNPFKALSLGAWYIFYSTYHIPHT